MPFWGVELKPGKPYVLGFDEVRRRLHVSQATLGFGSSTKKSVVQCSVGYKSPVLLCALLPEKIESCSLSLEFEDEEVTLSVVGPRSVHLTGFYFGLDNTADNESEDSGAYGEDSEDMETGQSIDDDTEDEEDYEKDFLDEDFETFLPHRPSSAVVIEEIHDEAKPVNGDITQKRPKKKTQKRDSDGKNDSQKQIVLKSDSSPVLESEDEDGFPIALSENNQNGASREKVDQVHKEKKNEKKRADVAVDRVIKSKRKIDAIELDSNWNMESSEQVDSLLQSNRSEVEEEGKAKKKKKQKARKGKSLEHGEDLSVDTLKEKVVDEKNSKMPSTDKIQKAKDDTLKDVEKGADTSAEAKIVEGKRKKKKSKSTNGDAGVESTEPRERAEGKKEPVKKIEDQKLKVQPSKKGLTQTAWLLRSYQWESLMAKEHRLERRQVFVRYMGKLKNGKIFDSNISGKPFEFRLGIGEVIKGWDVGVEGMRVGDKRHLTIPPSMGYGSKRVEMIPANSWLAFDVELVDVQ